MPIVLGTLLYPNHSLFIICFLVAQILTFIVSYLMHPLCIAVTTLTTSRELTIEMLAMTIY